MTSGAGPNPSSSAEPTIWRDAIEFVRFTGFGATLAVVFMGAAQSGAHRIDGRDMVTLIVLASAFHAYAYLLNDLVDLPIDRTEPRRFADPLVRGAISPRWAALTALIAFAVLGVVIVRGEPSVRVTLGAAVGLMTVYDLWGKRVGVPIVMDFIQGIGWATLLLAGAAIAGSLTASAWALAAFTLLFILMANGVHGALRDLDNDAGHDVRSTAITWGAHSLGGRRYVPTGLIVWAGALHLSGSSILVVTSAAMFDTTVGWAVSALTAAMLLTLSTVALWRAERALDEPRGLDVEYLGMLHLFALLGAAISVAVYDAPPLTIPFLTIGFVIPILFHPWMVGAVRSALRRREPARSQVDR